MKQNHRGPLLVPLFVLLFLLGSPCGDAWAGENQAWRKKDCAQVEEAHKMNCDVCGRNMTSKCGNNIVGISVDLSGFSEEMKIAMKEVYPEIKLDKSYNVCDVCWFRSFGLKLK